MSWYTALIALKANSGMWFFFSPNVIVCCVFYCFPKCWTAWGTELWVWGTEETGNTEVFEVSTKMRSVWIMFVFMQCFTAVWVGILKHKKKAHFNVGSGIGSNCWGLFKLNFIFPILLFFVNVSQKISPEPMESFLKCFPLCWHMNWSIIYNHQVSSHLLSLIQMCISSDPAGIWF